ncbi:MAG TPA: sigma-70 family RNA polymerase sigma factor [Solirubrobacteraceae bacterium]|jgi:DNA-directed RNA polymerase specialized sigma24 family protein|nr:sigma-70 family RNA polymerase sigma factor [Solirubrobacteraceae bacterium]
MGDHEQRDAALVAAIGQGDAAAFDQLYARYLPLVVRWSMHATGNREVAADLTAEVFAASLTAARRFRPERGSVAGWLLGIARNKLRESRRRGRVESSSRRRLRIEPVSLMFSRSFAALSIAARIYPGICASGRVSRGRRSPRWWAWWRPARRWRRAGS